MDRRIFLASCSALGLHALAPGNLFAKPLACAADELGGHSLKHIDGLAMLATCPAICLQEIYGILNEEELVCIGLDDLRYMLAEANHLTYLAGSASGINSIPDAARQAMLAAPIPIYGIEKILVMLTANHSFLRLRDIEVLQKCVAEYVGREITLVLGTINNERMQAGEVRIGILVPSLTLPCYQKLS